MIDDQIIESLKLSNNIFLWECIYGTNRDAPRSFVKKAKKYLNWNHIYNLIGCAQEWQIIRDYFNDIVVVHWGGAFRPLEWELLKGRSGKSQHVDANGIDAHLVNTPLPIVYEFINKTFKSGGRGINIPENFIHKDKRPYFAIWRY